MVDNNKDIGGLDFTVGEPKERGGSNIESLEEDTLYSVKLVEVVKENAPFGPVLKWIFELVDEEFSYEYEEETRYRRIKGSTTLLCNTKTKLYSWYVKLLGREPEVGEQISLKDIIGAECKVFVKNNKGKKADDEGNYPIYSNVDRIVIDKKAKKSTSSKAKTPKPSKKVKSKEKKVKPDVVEDDEAGDDLFDDVF